jgi:hypothetical protein
MTSKELKTLNSLVVFAAENIPGGLKSDEQEVARIVAVWAIDGVPVRAMCPHCGDVVPYGEGRVPWLEAHIDSAFHRWWMGLKRLGLKSHLGRR